MTNERKFLCLNDINAYKQSFNISNQVWLIAIKMDYFNRDTLGKQLVRAIDSISANIAEGFGRYHKKDKIKFYYNARGSLYESLDWLEKAKVRQIIFVDVYQDLHAQLKKLPREINNLISYTNSHLTI